MLHALVACLASVTMASAALANDPPEIVAPASVAGDPGQFLLFNVNTSDPNGDSVTLEASNVPSGATFRLDGNGNGSFIWRPGADDEGFYVMTLIATDDGDPVMSTMMDVEITVGDPNLPPVLDPIGDQVATVGLTLVVPLFATDPEGDPLVFSTDPVLDGTLIQQDTSGTASFEYTPGPAAVGNQVLTFIVSDGGSTDEETIVITVGAANVPPVLQAVGDRQAEVDSFFEILLMAQDPDGDALSFSAVGLPSGLMLTDNGDGTARIDGVPDTVGIFGVTVSVFDDGVPSEGAAETFDIDVQPAPEPEPELMLLEASFSRGQLRFTGQGALPGAPVALMDPTTGGLLGETTADDNGLFAGELRPFVPPCSVEAHSDGAVSPALAVDGAPAGCSQMPSTKVMMALWKCRLGVWVAGVRAAPEATLRLYDADTAELLAVSHASRRGNFLLRGRPDERPDFVQVSVEMGGVEWMLDPHPVRGRACLSGHGKKRGHEKHRHHGRHHGHRSCED